MEMYMYSMEYYSAIKKKNFACKWMVLENILIVVTQTQKDKHMIFLMCRR